MPDVTTEPLVLHEGDGTKAVTDFAEDVKHLLVAKDGEPNDRLREAIEAGALTVEQMAQIDIMQLSGSCDILACTVPTPKNGHVAVSMYHNPHATTINERATALAHGCGHTAATIKGDAMVSRLIDNEEADIWKRIDIAAEEIHPEADWVKACTRKGGGGGHGGSGSSLSSSMANLKGQLEGGGGGGPDPALQNLAQQMKSMKMKAKPNEKCPCGSGKKFKKCCGDPSLGR